ncbi:plexin A3 isoform X1 [Hyalella azteca]|uniref:Plexin A3 isoform X1 n=1 Tax=Hyalella azteca TaxID=294128 RepID=A0A8B7P1M5_HYAAZ|nr:plexin A3 isoform X1 [Hyalella azteca]XP_047735713.1 plexin A3 isoform X1 [Hyalella azteca]
MRASHKAAGGESASPTAPKDDSGGGGGADSMSAIGADAPHRIAPTRTRASASMIDPKRHLLWYSYISFAMLALLMVASSASALMAEATHDSLFIVERFEDEEWQSFQHIAVDKSSGNVYAAGVNRLYQLDLNLNLIQTVVTGPIDDAMQCSATGCAGDAIKAMKPTDNINKVLLLDYLRARVIVCGTVRQGSCQVRDLSNITILTRNVSEPIAANNASTSTVAFIAQGPPYYPRSHVLYIGVTYSGESSYRHEVPAVASRSLEDDRFFEVAVTDVTTSTRMLVNNLHRSSFPITYVHGFGSGKFSYFLTRQRADVKAESHYLSKLVRICQNDSAYYSYTEVPLKCRDSSGKDYNLVQAAFVGKAGNELSSQLGIQIKDDVLFAVFSPSDPSKGAGSAYPTSESALCVYSLKNIQTKFIHNIQECFRGNGYRGLDFISTSNKCIATRIRDINEDFCGMDVNTPLGGEQAIEVVALLTFPVRLTAVAITSTETYTVVYLGTTNGHLKKVVVGDQNSALEYGDITVDEGSPVRQDMFFDKEGDHLYVVTSNKISKVKAQECSIYKGCEQCLGARDPYCGWCSLENKCSLRRDCRDATQDPQHWVSYKTGRCTTIAKVSPDKLQRTTARTLNLIIENLPSVEGPLECVFRAMNKVLTTPAKRTAQGVQCTTPRNDMLPDIPQNQHHFTADLWVRKEEGPEFVSTNFTFFDCNTYSSCTECVSSDFPCDWCVDGHRCTHDSAENCRNDVLVNGVKRVGPSIRSGPTFCPRITVVESEEILVSSGTEKSIKVKVDNIAQFITQTRFVCQFNIEGRVTSVTAKLLSDTIYCDKMEFVYTTPSPSTNASFAVIWGGSKPLDNPDDIHVLVYQCQLMADNCGQCLSLSERYQCGWCQSTGRCMVSDKCSGGSAWLQRDKTCPNINVTSFYPETGPWEGDTNVTIHGINLGKHFNDIYDGITIAGIQCQPFQETYVPTEQVTCRVDSPGIDEYKEGPVVVMVAKEFRGESAGKYKFVNPKITSVTPTSGPLSGGTVIYISGEHMNAGSNITASIAGLPCHIITSNSTVAWCRTSASHKRHQGSVVMRFDKGVRELAGQRFTYVDDPVITSVRSGRAGQAAGMRNGPRGIPNGGIIITVDGRGFDVIAEPKMYVEYDDVEFNSPCFVKNDTRMECRTPEILIPPERERELDPTNGMNLMYGFIMDNVTSVRNLPQNNHNSLQYFSLFPDPEYYAFGEDDDTVKEYKSDYLTINGANLDRASQELDVEVRIGDEFCNVTSLSRSQLTCRPPEEQPSPAPGDKSDTGLPLVVVKIGNKLEYRIGRLQYSGLSEVGAFNQQLIIGLSVGAVVLIIILIVCLIVYRQKSNQNSRVLKNMQEQMDVLELRVAAECKEAFAELQTEMTDLTSDLIGAGGIPFLDYRFYTMKILFPNMDETSVLQMERPDLDRKEKGLKIFNQLILNKTFLLLFIRTLEANRYFSMRDRVNVASLIMVALQGKMEYCSDILKTLLAELIERCIDGKIHPKLLFRRTESVAEKMLSSWFTFLLYKFLKECAGEPLYMLFRAIKQQVDKGPVDAVFSEARYSLSEEKLIRQSIEYKEMTVEVSMCQIYLGGGGDGTVEGGETPVKVLDCDTISQVKEKALDAIYRYYPYSHRPWRDELDLEWRTGTSGRLILYDEDSTTRAESGWKRLNTLSHYNVPDMAQLTLIPKQSSLYNYMSMLSDKSDKSHHQNQHHNHQSQQHQKYETLNLSKFSSASPPLSRATSPLNHDNDAGVKNFSYSRVRSPKGSTFADDTTFLHPAFQQRQRDTQSFDNNCRNNKVWHLVRQQETEQREGEQRSNKMVSEIYLTRLLSTKLTLQKFVDDLFETIFSIAHRGSALPLAIKYMFDFLDDQALQHGITDPEVVHTWKSNSLPLRFWVNLIKNPNFVFDIHKSNIVDACLSVVAQTFMDSCSTSDHRLGKDSPSSKLLYAKDIPIYKEWVDRYYSDIKMMQPISDQDMNAMLAEESRMHASEFNTMAALAELYGYAFKYNDQLILALEEDEFSTKQRLAYKLEQIHNIMSND